MPIIKPPEAVTTKTGQTVTLSYCRKCMRSLPAKEFHECNDNGFIDANGLFSVCKECMQNMYDELFVQNQSMEKTVHKMCMSLNVKFSNEAMDATKTHINTLMQGGKNVTSIFGIYRQKLIATNKSMDKSATEDNTYEDVGTIYTDKTINTKEIPIPQDVLEFWGTSIKKEDIPFLEMQYANFKQTHKADTYAEIILLKQVCYTILDIEHKRKTGDDTSDLVKELQSVMKTMAVSPNAKTAGGAQGGDAFGLWIADIERSEPAQWLKTDPRGDIYRDVGNTEEYFQKYIVRPLRNAITSSKDFNIDDSEEVDDELIENATKMDNSLIKDGELD